MTTNTERLAPNPLAEILEPIRQRVLRERSRGRRRQGRKQPWGRGNWHAGL